jgi:hypothetical protein
MTCTNGEQMQIEGERGIFFICQTGDYAGNHCRFIRWCGVENRYVMLKDINCKDFITAPKETK